MRIREIREVTVPLSGAVSNAVVNFNGHTVSVVAVISDATRQGKSVAGVAFNSIGRYGQAGILQERMIPRLLAAEPETLLDASTGGFDPAAVAACAMRNEKPGGHGDRAAALGALELAFWDLNAKLENEPAYATIARAFSLETADQGIPVYAAGGYYRGDNNVEALRDELRAYADLGFDAFKIKIGGAPLAEDTARIEVALAIAGSGRRLAVDANGRFDIDMALAYARAMRPYDLRWYEEAGDPADYDALRTLAEAYDAPIATGENLFSTQDVTNLLRYGGMRPGLDVFQMDAGLSYGLTEYARMLALLEERGFDRRSMQPHGGHLINLHIATALGLGGCEAYPGVFQPFGGYCDECRIEDGLIRPGQSPGFGLEAKAELRPIIKDMLA